MTPRRCFICAQSSADHTMPRLARHGYVPHRFDPGERRQGERRGAGRQQPTTQADQQPLERRQAS